jgi:serine/threonine protein kinase
MGKPAFKRVEELFHQAVTLGLSERTAFLEAACAGEPQLRAAVEDLLKHDQGEGQPDTFLISPVTDEAERLRSDQPTQLDLGQGRGISPESNLPSIPGYELLQELGRGGMGIVYLARQTNLNRIVALKMLLPGSATDPALLARFRVEAESLARLNHPNIVPIYDFGECEGRPYFTMEYVAGPSLAQLLNGHAQDVAGTARLLEVVARALHAVHECGLIHRDLKPGNILLQHLATAEHGSTRIKEPRSEAPTPSPFSSFIRADPCSAVANSFLPKITDFGLAKDPTAGPNLTQTGLAMGTPSYMAPEQAQGKAGEVGPAADIYALGSILYEMLTGRPPFVADTAAEALTQLVHEEPLSPSRLRSGLPKDIVTICLKCLEKSPRRRYASAWDLAEDLRRFQAGEPIRARPVGKLERAYRWSRRQPLTAALLGLCSLLALAFVISLVVFDFQLDAARAKAEGKAEDERLQIVQLNLRVVQLHTNCGLAELEAGDTFAAVLRFTEALRLDGDEAHQRNHRTRIAAALRYSPKLIQVQTLTQGIVCADIDVEKGRIATVNDEGLLQIWDLAGAKPLAGPHRLRAGVKQVLFSTDAERIITVGSDGSRETWRVQSGELLATPSQPTAPLTQEQRSPDGRLVLRWDAGRVRVWDTATGQPLSPHLGAGDPIKAAAFCAAGKQVVTVSKNGTVRVWEVPPGPRFGTAPPSEGTRHARSPDGSRVVTVADERTACVCDAATGELLAAPLKHSQAIKKVSFAADGNLVCLELEGGVVCTWDLTPDDRPVDALVALAQVHAGRYINEKQAYKVLESGRLRQAWEALHK